jgi:ABC-type multidrug transport system fused ATPase/permease subunit
MRAMYAAIWRVTAREQMLLILLALLVSVLAAAPLKFQQLVVNSLIEGGNVGLLVTLCAGFLLVVLLSAALKFALNYGMSLTGERVILTIRERLYRNQVTDTRAGTGEMPKRGALLSMLSTEAEALGKFAGSAVASPLVQLGTLVSVLGFIVTAQPWLGILALGVVLPQAVIVLAIFRSASTVRVKHAMLADALAERPGHGAAGAPAAAPT